MKTTQTILVVIILLAGMFTFLWFKNKDPKIITIPPASSIKGCYVATIGKDIYTLTILSQERESAEGTLNFKNYQKDSSSGTFKGTYKDEILLGEYSFQSEGMYSIMQVIFKKSGDYFVRGYGDLNENGDRFADLSNITYDSSSPLSVFKASENCNTTSL